MARAILFTGPGAAALEEAAVPAPPPGHALIRVEACGLCHTDVAILEGGYGPGSYPVVPGHEYVGVVEALGEGVSDLAPGDRIAVDPNLACGACDACRRAFPNLCERLGAYGVTENGGFAQASLVRTDHLHRIGDMDPALAALAEPLGCVLNGLRVAKTGAPERAVVFGAGPIGLMLALALRAKHGARVTVVDRLRERLDRAEGLGFAAAEAGAAPRRAFDFAGDATGVPAVVEALPEALVDGGTALVMGVCPREARIALSPYDLFRRQIALIGAHSLIGPVDIPGALALLAERPREFERLVTHRLPLTEVLPFITKGGADASAMKVQFAPDA